jgi:hypothetical protein
MAMRTHRSFDLVLAVLGTALAALPIVATLLTSVLGSTAAGRFLMDFLMPAELAPAAFGGGALLLLVAVRTHRRRVTLGGSLGLALAAFAAMSAAAVWTGLASGEVPPRGAPLVLVIGLLVLYTVAVVALAVEGGRLVRDLHVAARRLAVRRAR